MKNVKLFEEFINEASFVVWYEDEKGKHLLGTFHNKKAAEKYKSEEEDEVLNHVGVKAIGTMSKNVWDKKEAPYINEGIWAMNKSKIKPFIKELENANDANDVKKIQKKYWNLVGDDSLMDYLDNAIKAKDISSDDFQDAIADAVGRLRDFMNESLVAEAKKDLVALQSIGAYIDQKTGMIHPMKRNGKPDLDPGMEVFIHDADHYEIMDQIEDEDEEIYQAMLKKFED